VVGLTLSFTWTGSQAYVQLVFQSRVLGVLCVPAGCGYGIPAPENTQRDRTHIILHMDGVSSGGPMRLSLKRLWGLWVSGGCGNRITGLVNTQRDRTHIVRSMDVVPSGGPIRLSVNRLGSCEYLPAGGRNSGTGKHSAWSGSHNTSHGWGFMRRSNQTFCQTFGGLVGIWQVRECNHGTCKHSV
jgi:hypothetical protein